MDKDGYVLSTALHACSIEGFVGRSDVFLCGLYELSESNTTEQAEQTREGGIALYKSYNGECIDLARRKGGVLDMKTFNSGSPEKHMIAVAYSTACLEVLTLVEGIDIENAMKLSSLASIEEPSEGLFLSVDWDAHSPGLRIAASTQAGNVLLFDLSIDEASGAYFLSLSSRISAHSLFDQPIPAWIVAFDTTGTRVISGGDDSCLKLWDLANPTTPIANINKLYTAGVTSGAWHPTASHLFAAGSYDETCRIWDARALKSPLHTLHTGGGVWRTKWNTAPLLESESFLVLACMHAGSSIYRVNVPSRPAALTPGVITCSKVAEHFDSDSDNHLAYGIQVLGMRSDRFDVFSCSFYDNKVHHWRARLI